MDMVCCMKATSKLSTPERYIEVFDLLFHHNILSKVKRHKISDALILSLDDSTPSK